MKNHAQIKSRTLAGLLLGATWFAASAQLSVLDGERQQVFEGDGRKISLQMRNRGDQPVEADLRAILSQASSATVVRISDKPWKKIQVLPAQTIVESATLDFPVVKAETQFVIQWVEGASNVVGRTEVLVYPTNLLRELKALAGEQEAALGVYDLQNQLKPLLKVVSIEFSDLEDVAVEAFHGKLAIVGPFAAKKQLREGLQAQIESLAKRGVSVVWLQPPPEKGDRLQPSFYAVASGKASVVVAQAELVPNLPENPQSQLNLIHCARLALRPESPHLPHLRLQPRTEIEL